MDLFKFKCPPEIALNCRPFKACYSNVHVSPTSHQGHALQKQVDHRVITLVADKLETERFTLVWKTNWIRQPKRKLPSCS